ncbi:hypothetical protein [Helicobacter japonicus]|uniref:hypothetical protein n=1 Tax=Helicobacter japonicus TaxID=425400 RepID=UPI0023F0F081|nr:hypothetical protein [Helicobacter japonicus]
MGMPVSFSAPIPQVIQSMSVAPQSEPHKDEITYKLDRLKSIYMMRGIGTSLNVGV